MRKILTIIPLFAVLSLVACGGGGSSSGGGGQPADECIEGTASFANGGTTVVTNSCAFNVNVLDLSENPDVGVTLVPANSTVTINDVILFFGACRAPSVPIRESSIQFKCS